MRKYLSIFFVIFLNTFSYAGENEIEVSRLENPCPKNSQQQAFLDVQQDIAKKHYSFFWVLLSPSIHVILNNDMEMDDSLLLHIIPEKIMHILFLHGGTTGFALCGDDSTEDSQGVEKRSIKYMAWYNTYFYNYLREHPEIVHDIMREHYPDFTDYVFPMPEGDKVLVIAGIDWEAKGDEQPILPTNAPDPLEWADYVVPRY